MSTVTTVLDPYWAQRASYIEDGVARLRMVTIEGTERERRMWLTARARAKRWGEMHGERKQDP